MWFRPMKGDVFPHLRLAYASAKSIKEQGYELALYTDHPEYFNEFPYDDVIMIDMKDYNPRLFSTVKYIALAQEPLGTIHLDYDIILNKSCITHDFGSDIIVQSRENFPYSVEKRFMYDNYIPKWIGEIGLNDFPFNVGVIGFFNHDAWNVFFENFIDAAVHYKTINIPEYINLDFLFEQSFISRLSEVKKYNVSFIYEYPRIKHIESNNYVENKVLGFTHYYGKSKFKKAIVDRYTQLLSEEDFNKLDRIGETKNHTDNGEVNGVAQSGS